MKKISIITVTYNCEETIRRTIESVINQNYTELEYIIIDGLSTDGTLDVVKAYAEKYSGIIKYISEKDSGLYDAMNKGIKIANGEIIGIINGDDFYTKDALSEVDKIFCTNDCDIVYSDLLYTCGDTINYRKPLVAEHNNLNKRMSVNHPTCFVKKEVYDKEGGFDLRFKIAADYELMARFYVNNYKFIKSSKILAVMEYGGLSSNNKKTIKEKYKVHSQYFGKKTAWCLLIKNTALYYYRVLRK